MFVVLDGIDGCGKTTQATRLVRALAAETGRETLHLREPGSTRLGEGLRAILLAPGQEIVPAAEALLFAAARRQMLDEIVAPALARGAHVVVERFHSSTFAYQGVAGGLGEDLVLDLLERFAGAPRPDLLIVLDLPAEVARGRRARESARASDRIEDKGIEFQSQVAAGFRRYVARTERAVLVDASRSEDDVAASVLLEVRRAL
ncbi:MAG TPA: dTMP kinase [Planctomycetota bacterium]|jgi:dTMP kinase|nr:dTMP kinase [Planctomycetota bacterium]